MKQSITIYVAQRAIPEFNIIAGSKLYIKDNVVYNLYNGKQYPPYLSVNNATYFKSTTYEFPVEPGEYITYYRPEDHRRAKHVYTGQVVAIDERNLQVVRDGTNGVIDTITHNKIKEKRIVYYYINSSGIIQKAIKGMNKEADWFRKKVQNYFDSKGEAQGKLQELKS